MRSSHKVRNTLIFLIVGAVSVQTGSILLLPKTTPDTPPIVRELTQPVAESKPVKSHLSTAMPWPTYGYAAYGVPVEQLYSTSQEDVEAVPIASLAKIITALAVLKAKPLEPGSRGPGIVLTEADVELVNEYARKSGVYLPVMAGTEITQYQALQAALLVSANNLTDTLAIWAFGSVENYAKYANEMLKELGLEKTYVADASGFSPQTVSTPEELVELGFAFMQHPVLREITEQKLATIPSAGVVGNSNAFANTDTIKGIKIGNTDEAGRCYMAADIRKMQDGSEEIAVAVVLGADNLETAALDAKKIITAGNKGHDSTKKAQ